MATGGDTLDGVRRRNLAAVLRLVHQSRGLSRVELTAATGLNRSTVGGLVAELVGLGLVVESGAEGARRVGRPSPVVRPAPAPAVVAVNPELDAVTVALVGLGARVDHRERIEADHPVSPAETAAIVEAAVDRLREQAPGRRLLGVGLAVPGLVRASDGEVRWAPHLGWRDVALPRLVADAVALPVVAGNDATLGAVAERLFGIGRGVDELVYLNGGASGIGGGVVVRGRPLAGAHGYAGEFGQNRPGLADPADRRTPDGTLEDEVSRARLLEHLGLDNPDEPELAAALLASRSEALDAEVRRQQRVLAVALSNAINVVNPELVVLGGFLAALLERDPAGLASLVEASSVPASFESVRIAPAALARDRLLIGAAEIALAPILDDPVRAAGDLS